MRSGRLPDNSLPDCIAAIQRDALPGDGPQPDLTTFQQALSRAVTAIAPMSLADLRAGRNPFDARNIQTRKRWQVGLSVATIALIATISYCHFMLQREDAALRAFVTARDAQWSEKITAARKIAQRQNALSEKSCNYDSYQLAVHEIRKLSDQTNMSWSAISALATGSAWPMFDRLVPPTLPAAAAASAAGIQEPSAGPKVVSTSGAAGAAGASLASAEGADVFDLCDPTHRPKKMVTNYPAWLKLVIENYVDETCFARVRNVNIESLNPNLSASYASIVAQRIALRTAWILPFLYGLLGSCVYVMRRLLSATEKAFVENVVILLRLALGALAGIVISWFAVPASGQMLGTASASSLPYVIAFLGGFSIDSVFNLLDNVTKTLSGAKDPKAVT